MTTTTNFELNIVEGTDKVNPLTQLNPNFETIDTQMEANKVNGTTSATELKTGTVHALNRADGDVALIQFTATSNFTAGDTFTVDGVQVSALLVSGEQLPTGAYIIGSTVLCYLKGTLLTFFTSTATIATAENANKLGGEEPSYYATKSALDTTTATANSASTIATQANTAVNELKNTISASFAYGKYIKVGKVVQINLSYYGTSTTTITLPFAPVSSFITVIKAFANNADSLCLLSCSTNKTCTISNASSTSLSANYLQGSFLYITEE